MSILLTGGSGRTASYIAKRLHEEEAPFLVLSRSGSAPAPYEGSRFDWNDKSTYQIPFTQAPHVKAIYIVLSTAVTDPKAQAARDFIDFACAKGVNRFVTLSMSNAEIGQRVTGAVHEYLTQCSVTYVALRPTWYMENFTHPKSAAIKDKGETYSATEDGKVSWISTDDVGEVAFKALTDDRLTNIDPILLGPELLSYDDVARILTEVTGKQIKHVRIPIAMHRAQLEAVVPDLADDLVAMEIEFSRNEEARPDNGEVERLIGRKPITFREWAEKNKSTWL